MGLTKSQISNFLNDKILFRFSISNEYIIKFSEHEEIFTFEELEKIIKRNYTYWSSIYNTAPNDFVSAWKTLNIKYDTIKNNISEFEILDINAIKNLFYNNLTSSYNTTEQGEMVYVISIGSPIDKDIEFRSIRKFVSFYIKHSQSSLDDAIKSFIYLSKNNNAIGSYFSNSSQHMFYPAIYLIRKNFSSVKDSTAELEKNIVDPLASQLKDISDDSNKQYREITSFIEEKYNQIQRQFNQKVYEFNEFQKSIENWQKEKQDNIADLEETYKNNLSLEAPQLLWNERAEEHKQKAKYWTVFLIVTVLALISALTVLVNVLHSYSLSPIKNKVPFISESFILISVISFFIYIVRILIKIVMSNHHLATEYRQKAALTRFYQALTYAGTDIDKEERLIIINSLFSRVETGLVKTDTSNDSDTILAILSKNL